MLRVLVKYYLSPVIISCGTIDGSATILLGLGKLHRSMVKFLHFQLIKVVGFFLCIFSCFLLPHLLFSPLPQLFILKFCTCFVIEIFTVKFLQTGNSTPKRNAMVCLMLNVETFTYCFTKNCQHINIEHMHLEI